MGGYSVTDRVGNLTVKQMLAARMLVEDHTYQETYKACDVHRITLQKWMTEPDFIAYQERVRAEHDAFFRAATQIERKKYKITLKELR